jgi:hypothetical protein
MRQNTTRLLALPAMALLLLTVQAMPVHPDSILNFGLSNAGSITAVANTGTGVTTLSTTGGAQAVTIDFIQGGSAPISAYLNLTATSSGQAVFALPSGDPTQIFNGSFSITQNANGTGTNYLTGTFTNMLFDAFVSGSGEAASLKASDPTASISYTSDVITSLIPPSALDFSFTNVTPGLSIVGPLGKWTIGSFTASGSGTFSASATPEPSSLAIAGLSALGLIGYGVRRRKTQAA